jgi:hypothetical protein
MPMRNFTACYDALEGKRAPDGSTFAYKNYTATSKKRYCGMRTSDALGAWNSRRSISNFREHGSSGISIAGGTRWLSIWPSRPSSRNGKTIRGRGGLVPTFVAHYDNGGTCASKTITTNDAGSLEKQALNGCPDEPEGMRLISITVQGRDATIWRAGRLDDEVCRQVFGR